MHTELHVRRPWEVPGRPPQPEPLRDEGAAGLPPWLSARLFEQRIVVLSGRVTGSAAATAAATLLSLDRHEPGPARTGFAGPDPGAGDDRDRTDAAAVQLHLSTRDGDLDAVFAVIDAIDAMSCPVEAVATAEVGGAALGIYAAAQRRLAYPHARFRLAEPSLAGMNGTADDVAAAAGAHLRAVEDLIVRVAAATGQPRSRVEDDFSTVRWLDATQAREYGLVHEIRSRA